MDENEGEAAPEVVDELGRKRQTHLAQQDVNKIDPNILTPLTPEIISRQATINIGTIGHVAHGKSTVVKSLSGVHTVRFKNELERNITIKLGYANAKIYENVAFGKNISSQPAQGEVVEESISRKNQVKYCSKGSNFPDKFTDELGDWELRRHVSFVDCPGHDILMATMLNGAAVMDAALLLIAGNESCPQPQTSEHLAAVEIMKLKNIIILQNKIDLVKEEAALKQKQEIENFVAGTVADSAPIVPLSAVLKYNVDIVCEYLCTKVPVPPRDFTSDVMMIIIRSFDVNKPGEEWQNLKGGVAGGSILRGILRIGDEIEVRPGIVSRKPDGTVKCVPIKSVVTSLYAENNDLNIAVPGGLIGVGTKIDPTLTRADRLVGQVLGLRGRLPNVYTEVEVGFYLLKRLLGVKNKASAEEKAKDKGKTASGKSKGAKVTKLEKGEVLLVNIGSTSTGGKVVATKNELAKIQLMTPVCTQEGEKIALSRRVERHWRLIGWGVIRKGTVVELS